MKEKVIITFQFSNTLLPRSFLCPKMASLLNTSSPIIRLSNNAKSYRRRFQAQLPSTTISLSLISRKFPSSLLYSSADNTHLDFPMYNLNYFLLFENILGKRFTVRATETDANEGWLKLFFFVICFPIFLKILIGLTVNLEVGLFKWI